MENDILESQNRKILKKEEIGNLERYIMGYDCVVCDEGHYFLTDSNYNTNTIKSFQWVMDNFNSKIRIIMSATIDDIKLYIEEEEEKRDFLATNTYRYPLYINTSLYSEAGESTVAPYGKKVWTYNLERNYDEVHVRVINDRKDMVGLINDKGGKWFIFVDSIKYGYSLKKELKDTLKGKSEIVVLTSEYEYDDEGRQEVENIAEKNEFSAPILISTSVMDNGISIKDILLRNIIIFADTKVEFIQMLGRKRQDGKPLELYIYKHSKNHFIRRQSQVMKRQELIEKYQEKFDARIGRPINCIKNYTDENLQKRIDMLYIFLNKGKYLLYSPFEMKALSLDEQILYLNWLLDLIAMIKIRNIDIDKEYSRIRALKEEEQNDLKKQVEEMDIRYLEDAMKVMDEPSRSEILLQVLDKVLLVDPEILSPDYESKIRVVTENFSKQEDNLIHKKHLEIMQNVANHTIKFEEASSIFRVEGGTLFLNPLSVRNLEILGGFYTKIIDAFDKEGENAFVKEQLSWLGKPPEEAEEIIQESQLADVEKSHKVVVEIIENNLNKVMNLNDAKTFKEKIHKDIKVLINNVDHEIPDWKKVSNSLYKTDRPISKGDMDFLREHCDLPYVLEVDNKSKTRTFRCAVDEDLPDT